MDHWSIPIPCQWPGSTIVCLGGGPSLTPVDIALCRSAGAHLLAVNDTYRLAPDAVALFAADRKWWYWHPDALQHAGLKYMFPPSDVKALPSVAVLRRSGQFGVDLADRASLCSGGHSGYAAVTLAAKLVGPDSRILLLGYDLQPSPADPEQHHWFGNHPDDSHPRYAQWRHVYQPLAAQLAAHRIALINCSRVTSMTGVPCQSLPAALELTHAAVR